MSNGFSEGCQEDGCVTLGCSEGDKGLDKAGPGWEESRASHRSKARQQVVRERSEGKF